MGRTTRSEHERDVAVAFRRRSDGRATGRMVSGSGLPSGQYGGGADLWTIPREEARTIGQDSGTSWGTTTERMTALQPKFEPQDRVASGKTARRSTGRAFTPNQDVRARDDGPRRPRRWQPPSLEGQGGQQRRPTSRSIISCFPSRPRAPCLHGVMDDEQVGSSPSWNGRSESSGKPRKRSQRSETVSPGNGGSLRVETIHGRRTL